MSTFCCLVFAVVAQTPVESAGWVYVSVAGEQRIAVFRSASDGKLTPVENVSLEAEPGALALSGDQKQLAAALRSSGQLASFARDRNSGKLTLKNVIPAGPDPAHLAFDAAGRLLFTAYYVAAKVTVHSLGDDQKLGEMPLQSITTADKAHAVVFSPGEKFAFVPHTGSEVIFQFRWNAEKRELIPNDPPRLTTAARTGPRHLVFHPKLMVAFVSNEQGNSVTTYQFDAAAGTLKPIHTESTLPSEFTGGNATAELRVHPNGRFLYCSNRGHDSLARFAVDPSDGKLKFLGTTATEKTPRSFDLDVSGRFLYAAGEESGKLACYHVDATSGELQRFQTIDVGRRPWWVLAAPDK